MSIASIEGIANQHFGVQRFSFGAFWSPTLQLWYILESNASALAHFGVQRFSFGILESNALPLILVNPDQI
ncbi:MAG: hypothetical protein KAI83_12315 [Thiomargarita sp.]|nr:hypothetical protein [Thiomargarita sp.]